MTVHPVGHIPMFANWHLWTDRWEIDPTTAKPMLADLVQATVEPIQSPESFLFHELTTRLPPRNSSLHFFREGHVPDITAQDSRGGRLTIRVDNPAAAWPEPPLNLWVRLCLAAALEEHQAYSGFAQFVNGVTLLRKSANKVALCVWLCNSEDTFVVRTVRETVVSYLGLQSRSGIHAKFSPHRFVLETLAGQGQQRAAPQQQLQHHQHHQHQHHHLPQHQHQHRQPQATASAARHPFPYVARSTPSLQPLPQSPPPTYLPYSHTLPFEQQTPTGLPPAPHPYHAHDCSVNTKALSDPPSFQHGSARAFAAATAPGQPAHPQLQLQKPQLHLQLGRQAPDAYSTARPLCNVLFHGCTPFTGCRPRDDQCPAQPPQTAAATTHHDAPPLSAL